jgi:hypothetical protein
MAVKTNDPFAAIAKPKTDSPKKGTVKIAATVTDEIKGKVDLVLHHKGAIKSLEAEQLEAETAIIEHVRPQQDEAALAGNFSKSFTVPGNTGTILYNTADSFSVPKDLDAIEEIKKLLGKKFEEVLEPKRTITLKPEAAANTDLIQKVMAAVSAAGLEMGDVFDVVDQYVAKPDLDRKQYELFPKKQALEQFRTLIKQKKASLK